MAANQLLLYVDSQFLSPYAMSVHVALTEKGVPFRTETLDLGAKANLAPGFAATSLTRRVPTLVHDGFTLSESSAITEYIDEVFPGVPLYPAEPKARARARQVQAWIRSDLMPIRVERSTDVVFLRTAKPALSADALAAADKLFAVASALLPAGADHLCGEQWCLADLDLALMLNRLVLAGDAVPEALAAYAGRQWQRPSVQQWVTRDRSGV